MFKIISGSKRKLRGFGGPSGATKASGGSRIIMDDAFRLVRNHSWKDGNLKNTIDKLKKLKERHDTKEISRKEKFESKLFRYYFLKEKHCLVVVWRGVSVIKYKNGAIYEGVFSMRSGSPKGYGKLSHDDGSWVRGMFENGKHKGEGKGIKYKNGVIYRGDFFCGQEWGEGVRKEPDGSSYRGLFTKGEFKNGIGRSKNKDGSFSEYYYLDGHSQGRPQFF